MASDLEETLAGQLRKAGESRFEREFRFHPTRRWRFDFAWPGHLVACEVEGGTWSGGRHTRGKGYESDCEKYNEAALLGWLVVRFPRSMILDGRALATVQRALDVREGEA